LSVPIPVFLIILTRIQNSVSVENVLYADERVSEVAAVGVPDARLGELVAAVVSIKSAYQSKVTEASLKSIAEKRYTLSGDGDIKLTSFQLAEVFCSGHDCHSGRAI